MNAPTIEQLDVNHLQPSPTNPRTQLPQVDLEADNAKLKELAASIHTHGVLLPLLVRPLKKSLYEIVCGHRRHEAAKLAGLTRVPCEVREMTDTEVVEVQLIELAQRVDVDPLAESKAYADLLGLCHGDVTEVALRVGKPRRHVAGRLCLAKAIPEAVARYRAGAWELGALQALGGLSAEQQQTVYAKAGDWPHMDGDGARRAIERFVLLALATAPFDTTDERLPGGPCARCPKRTGSQPDLFGHISDSSEMCLDAGCFAGKKAAAWEWKCKEAKDAGQKVLTAAESKRVFAEPEYGPVSTKKGAGFVELAMPCLDDPKRRTYAQLLGKKATVTLACDSKGVAHELVELTKEVKATLAAKMPKPKPPPEKAPLAAPAVEDPAPRAGRAEKPEASDASILRVLYRHGWENLKAQPGTMWPVSTPWLRDVVELVLQLSSDNAEVLAAALEVEDAGAELRKIQSTEHMASLLAIVTHIPCLGRAYWHKDSLHRACTALKLDADQVEREALALDSPPPAPTPVVDRELIERIRADLIGSTPPPDEPEKAAGKSKGGKGKKAVANG